MLSIPAILTAAENPVTTPAGMEWVQSPYRHFLAGQAVAGSRAILFDEADDPELRAGLGAELPRLESELYGRQGWRSPFAADDPLRVYVARGESGGVRAVASRSVEAGRLVAPAVLIDAAGLSSAEIVREIGRQIARATLAGYGVDDPFLSPALATFLSAPPAEAKDAQAWTLAAGGQLDVRAHPEALGRLWVAEVARATGGEAVLREAWQRAAASGESPTSVMLRAVADEPGQSEDALLLRAAARLYMSIEPETSPSRLRLLDVESGAIDAAPPAGFTVRHRTFLPESEETLRVAWPQDGGAGAAVVRYRDAALPPDVAFFAAGDRRAIPLAGVARVDFLVAGSASGGRGVAAPVYAELSAAVPFSGLEARADSGADGARLTWTTASHEGMWGWAVFREEMTADGRLARTGPEIVPSAESSPGSFRYEYLDSGAAPGTYYRYTVWAVTSEGLLARAFSATLKSPEP
ncbi:MAG TPA: hypothetical protein VGG65_02400 [Thermoanaerobaculia bacterium]